MLGKQYDIQYTLSYDASVAKPGGVAQFKCCVYKWQQTNVTDSTINNNHF